MFTLDPHSGIPIYRQLMDQVRWLTASNQLKPGDALPSVRELAIEHAVNAMTISKAYSLLEAEGILTRQRGKPMTVSSDLGRKESKALRIQARLPVYLYIQQGRFLIQSLKQHQRLQPWQDLP